MSEHATTEPITRKCIFGRNILSNILRSLWICIYGSNGQQSPADYPDHTNSCRRSTIKGIIMSGYINHTIESTTRSSIRRGKCYFLVDGRPRDRLLGTCWCNKDRFSMESWNLSFRTRDMVTFTECWIHSCKCHKWGTIRQLPRPLTILYVDPPSFLRAILTFCRHSFHERRNIPRPMVCNTCYGGT